MDITTDHVFYSGFHYRVTADGRAVSELTTYMRSAEGRWQTIGGHNTSPGLNAALEAKYRALVGEGDEI